MSNMIQNAKDSIQTLLTDACARAAEKGQLPAGAVLTGTVEIPKDTLNGDYAANHAMTGARALHMAPRKIAEALVENLALEGSWFSSVEVAGPGFINFRLAPSWYGDVLGCVTQEGADYYALMLRILDECAAADIHKLVMHTTVGNHPPETCALGFVRYRTMCDYAKEKDVHICFENLEPFPHLHEIMAAIDDPFHGFCWDCGHNLCYTPHIDMMALYADRLMCLHLHDNRGVTQPGNIDFRDDLHMLPFDGVLDWDWTARKIARSGYDGPLTFEYSSRTARRHADKPYSDFLKTAMERAQKFRAMVETIEQEPEKEI